MKKTSLRVACLQMSAGDNVHLNMRTADRLLSRAHKQRVELACLPEAFIYRGSHRASKRIVETIPGPLTRHFQKRAAALNIHILLGSILERSPRPDKCYNTSVLIGNHGQIIATYRKKHLFDIKRRHITHQESRHVRPGRREVIASVLGVSVALTICYDLRFPEFIGRLVARGAEVILLPANFTENTGKAHWDILLRARAIENLCFVVAPGQGGENPHSHLRAYGRSLIVDPWGKVLAKAHGRRNDLITATLDLTRLRDIRKSFPTLEKRFSS